jgi:hypothetical protein
MLLGKQHVQMLAPFFGQASLQNDVLKTTIHNLHTDCSNKFYFYKRLLMLASLLSLLLFHSSRTFSLTTNIKLSYIELLYYIKEL